jgi:dienelactone hydrolase
MRRRWKRWAITTSSYSTGYDGAGHAFLNFANAERYRPEAKDAWAKMLDFLDRHVKDRTAR